jgi:hypothetical protein
MLSASSVVALCYKGLILVKQLVLQSGGGGDAPLLWMAGELAAPLNAQLAELFGSSAPGSPGDVQNPDLLLGTVHRLALENGRRIDFLQVRVLEGLVRRHTMLR